MDLREAGRLGDPAAHWYYRAKLAVLLRLVAHLPPGPVLDVGAGSGFFARALLRAGRATAATCVDPHYPAERDEQVADAALRLRRQADPAAASARLVLLMDVLEHVRDDLALARHYVDRAAPGTTFVVTVPAFQWLWSPHDVFLGHHRRYTLRRLEATLRAAGLEVQSGSYYYGAVLPVVAALRLGRRLVRPRAAPRSDMRPFGPLLNAVLWAACRAELPFLRRNRLAGLTAVVCAVKP